MADEEPQRHERPRPQFGELAPPGWVWKPPEDADRLDTARPNPVADDDEIAPAPPLPPRTAAPTDAPGDGQGRGQGHEPAPTSAPRWNRTLTLLLIIFGFLGMTYSVGVLQAFPGQMQILHEAQGLGDFTPAPVIGTLVTVGTLLMTGLWAVSAGLSVWQLVRRRLSFYIPLTAGVVAMIALFVIVAVMLSTDPALVDFYSGLVPASPAPTTPATPATP